MWPDLHTLDESRSVLASYHLSADETARELNGSVPLDMRFPIASVTKTLTALLAARLCVDGVLSWAEPLGPAGGIAHPMSLRGLLAHTAGVPFELRPGHWTGPSLTSSELTSSFTDPPRLPLPPGTWHYSNLGYAIVARLLEQATGQDYPALLAEHLLRPLGMTLTSLPKEQLEGPAVLGAAAPAGDLWSTLGDLMTLARALDGRRPDVVTWPMLAMLLDTAIPVNGGTHLGAGIRTHHIGQHRVLLSTGTISNWTTCVLIWPRRGSSILVAEAGYSHDALRDAAVQHWRRDDATVRTWWWDGQEIIELRHGDHVELVLRETTWPFPIFSGQAGNDHSLVGVDWCGRPLRLLRRGDSLLGPDLRVTADVAGSAYQTSEQA